MSRLESFGRSALAPFFVVSAAMEIAAGVALLAAPHLAIGLVSDSSATEAAVALGRLAGGALLSLGAACWLARDDGLSAASSALARAMLTYNAAVVALALTGSLGSLGPLLWVLALVHGGMALWCLVVGPKMSARVQ
jgi:hypothetical protein